MSKALVKALALFASVLAATAPELGFAGTCDVPVTAWQPREALRLMLEAAGWHVRTITVRNGCYAAIMSDDSGREAEALFDPGTLKVLEDE